MANENKAHVFLHDWLYAGRHEKIFIAASIVRKFSSRVMSATPTKVCERERKPKIDIQKNSSCRFYGVKFTSLLQTFIWKSIFLWSFWHHMIQMKLFTRKSCWLLCVLDMPLLDLVQARPWFRSPTWISSIAGISRMLCTSVVATSATRRIAFSK